jgi:hypothetical protein
VLLLSWVRSTDITTDIEDVDASVLIMVIIMDTIITDIGTDTMELTTDLGDLLLLVLVPLLVLLLEDLEESLLPKPKLSLLALGDGDLMEEFTTILKPKLRPRHTLMDLGVPLMPMLMLKPLPIIPMDLDILEDLSSDPPDLLSLDPRNNHKIVFAR